MLRTSLLALAMLSLMAIGCGKKDDGGGGGGDKPAEAGDSPFKAHHDSVQGLLDVFEKAGDPDKALEEGQKYVDSNLEAVKANCKKVVEWRQDTAKSKGAAKYNFNFRELQTKMKTLAKDDMMKMGKLFKVLEQIRNCDNVLKQG